MCVHLMLVSMLMCTEFQGESLRQATTFPYVLRVHYYLVAFFSNMIVFSSFFLFKRCAKGVYLKSGNMY